MIALLSLVTVLIVLSSGNLRQAAVHLWNETTYWIRWGIAVWFLVPLILFLIAHANMPKLTLIATLMIPGTLLAIFLVRISPLWPLIIEALPEVELLQALGADPLARALRFIQRSIFWGLAAQIGFGVVLCFMRFENSGSGLRGEAPIILLIFAVYLGKVLAGWGNHKLPFSNTALVFLVVIGSMGGWDATRLKFRTVYHDLGAGEPVPWRELVFGREAQDLVVFADGRAFKGEKLTQFVLEPGKARYVASPDDTLFLRWRARNPHEERVLSTVRQYANGQSEKLPFDYKENWQQSGIVGAWFRNDSPNMRAVVTVIRVPNSEL